GRPAIKKPKAEKAKEPWRKKYVAMEKVDGSGWTIGKTGDKYGISSRRNQVFATQEEAEKAIPLYAVAEKHYVYTDRENKKEFAIFKRVGKRKLFKVVGKTFPSREEGMKYMATHAEEILNTKTTFGEEILPVPEIAVRTGKERRKTDATPEMFMETFTPRGIEFGNWNNQDERQQVLNHAYDGLLDLAEVLNVPPKALMLNGDLAIAFGARGQGLSGAKAHYEPGYGVINLTKMRGAGSLAHEWFHALDHYLARQDTKASSEKETNKRGDLVYKTGRNREDFQSHGKSYKSKVRPELQAAYGNVVDTMYKKAKAYVEDMSYAEKFLGTARENLKKKLDAIRSNLAKDLTETYTWRKNKRGLSPASAEQLVEFDNLSNVLIEGGNLQTKYMLSDGSSKTRSGVGGRHTNDTLESMSVILKAVRNTNGFDSQHQRGMLDGVSRAMTTYSERIKLFEDAEKGTEKTKTVPTEYAVEAKKMDQARTGDYWSEPHEMAARAFSAYVEDKIAEQGNQSDFIVYQAHGGILLPMIDGFVARPYPEGQERVDINKAFDGFVNTLKTKETDKGVAMYEIGAYHGSPHAFDSFSTEKIGTGEGAQAFGWGLYFTDEESLGRHYADVLTRGRIIFNSKDLKRDEFADEIAKEYGEEYRDLGFHIGWDFLNGYWNDQILRNVKRNFGDDEKTLNTANEILEGMEHPDTRQGWIVKPKAGARVENKMSKKDRSLLFDIGSRFHWYKKNVDAVGEVKNMLHKTVEAQSERLERSKEWNFNEADIKDIEQTRDNAKRMLEMFDDYDLVAKYNEPSRNLYKVTLHKNKKPGEYTWLDWHEQPTLKQLDAIRRQITAEFSPGNPVYTSMMDSVSVLRSDLMQEYLSWQKTVLDEKYGKGWLGSELTADEMITSRRYKEQIDELIDDSYPEADLIDDGMGLYRHLEYTLGSDREASLFLLRAGIDGNRYPSGTLSGIKDSDKFNYVTFDENDVTIEEHERYQLGKSIPVVGNQTLVDVLRKAPPLSGATFGLSDDGSIWVRNKSGMGFNVKSVTHIEADKVALEVGHGKMMLENGEFIKGKSEGATIELQRDMADEWTATHETLHQMKKMGLI
ncbi:MAG TPA: LPD1 domain-containing protein, partial [Candidatus Bathyarchaeia archaeon]|nr:LPD1 domain-containing protein [Candidatus Bathyarchaeia archaeon]